MEVKDRLPAIRLLWQSPLYQEAPVPVARSQRLVAEIQLAMYMNVVLDSDSLVVTRFNPRTAVSRRVSDIQAIPGARSYPRDNRRSAWTVSGRRFGSIQTEVEFEQFAQEVEADIDRLYNELADVLKVARPVSHFRRGQASARFFRGANSREEVQEAHRVLEILTERHRPFPPAAFSAVATR